MRHVCPHHGETSDSLCPICGMIQDYEKLLDEMKTKEAAMVLSGCGIHVNYDTITHYKKFGMTFDTGQK